MESEDGATNAGTSEILQYLLEERRQREAEKIVERRRWEEERKVREEELIEERRRRDEEMTLKDEQMSRQMEILQSLVQGVQQQGKAAICRAENSKDVNVPKLTEQDDIVSYLTMFERLMTAYEVKKEKWAFKLASHLTGRAQKAYSALSIEEAGDYAKLKEAILKRYDITEESYRQRFRQAKKKSEESNKELVARLNDLATKWLQDYTSREELMDQVILEQFLKTLPDEIRVFVRERRPKYCEDAGKLADDYLQARKESQVDCVDKKVTEPKKNGDKSSRQCHKCGKPGHIAKDCRVKLVKSLEQENRPAKTERPRRDLCDVECFNCHKKGHYSSNCPHNAMHCTERSVDYRGNFSGLKRQTIALTGVVKQGVVEGKSVDNILLDTGCSRTLVHQDLVPEGRIKEGEAVAIRCAHGDTVLYPLAQISIEVEGHSIDVEAAVSSTLPMAVLLGTDTLELADLLVGDKATEDALVVSTRAKAKKQLREAEEYLRKEEDCGVQSHQLEANHQEGDTSVSDTDRSVWMSELDEDLFVNGREKVMKTRSEKRAERKRRENLQVEEENESMDTYENAMDSHELDISATELKRLQVEDSTLSGIRNVVQTHESVTGVGFFSNDGILYRRWVSPGRDEETMSVEQLVLPLKFRETVMKLAHSIPLAGHLGKNKTTNRVLQRFYWPTVHRDIAKFCRTCVSCQKSSRRKAVRAPLIPLPIISQPFERIAMDIVGPLPRSRHGNRYILVVCDYATRYPEAVALKYIDAETIADELIKIFARVGIPREVLTDQGANFTSQMLTELYRMLHVRPIKTTPYHPQTDGLVERFNQTLKSMLRKSATEKGKDWDTLLPYLLFAYREVPQSSTGFSPFELLYGHTVRGPLDVLKESWQMSHKSEESVVSHVLAIREKIDRMKIIADTNLKKAQEQQQLWYNQNSREREFNTDDLVLLLLPTTTNKLLAKWQGPYRVIKRVGRVNYLIDMHDHRRSKRIYHVNLLKKWEAPVTECCVAEELNEDDFPDWRGNIEETQPTVGNQLSDGEKKEIRKIFVEFSDVLQVKPGRTNLIEHSINTGTARPIKLPPYRIPHAYRESVVKELEEMSQTGIIEPSQSEWSSPIVVVKKKDGNIRLCLDYRRLNAVTPIDAYPMPRTDELIDKLGKAKFITTLDLCRGYWQVPMSKQDRDKTAFITPNGLFQFKVMPFGLSGAPATFQRMMDKLLRGLEKWAASYLDDIVIFSESWEEHLINIREVLFRLRTNGLTAKPVKCQFCMRECMYLGHVVGNGQVRPDPAKLHAVENFPTPVTKKQVRGFLGLTGYYRKFIENYATIAAPLSDLTKKSISQTKFIGVEHANRLLSL